MIGHVEGGGSVGGADDADGAGQPEDQVVIAGGFGQHHGDQRQRHKERGEDAELRRRPEEDHRGVLEQGRKIDHRAHGDEDENREQLVGDARVKQHAQESVFAQHAGGGLPAHRVDHGRQVGQNRAKADGQQQRRLIVLFDRQIDQHPGDDEHHQRFQPFHGKQIRHTRKQLTQNQPDIQGGCTPFVVFPFRFAWPRIGPHYTIAGRQSQSAPAPKPLSWRSLDTPLPAPR